MWEGDYAALGNMDLHFCSQGFDEEPQWNFYKSHILSYVKKNRKISANSRKSPNSMKLRGFRFSNLWGGWFETILLVRFS